MLRRIGAIALLIGFVLLIANILVFHYAPNESLVIYAIIAVAFILTQGRGKKPKE